ncbi:MAG: hypothetical protein KDH93_00270 [Rhodoferax sp.]|nr:hypothetical protein [Rhodoferax sp.]
MPLSTSHESRNANASPSPIRPVVYAQLRAATPADQTGRLARDLAWQWVASKWPRLLPSAAGMDSDHYARSAPGQKLVAASQAHGGWAMTVAYDERHGSRTWVTHVEIGRADGAPTLSIQTGCTAQVDTPLVVAPPRLLGSWVERLELVDGPVGVISEPRTVSDPEQLENFLAHVSSTRRTLPIIALANRPGTRFFGVDPAGLAMAVRGLAHVACLSPEVSDAVAERLGPHLGVVAGAARIYGAGVPIAASSRQHPLVRNHHAGGSSPANAGAFRRQLCQRICALSVRHLVDTPAAAPQRSRHAAEA